MAFTEESLVISGLLGEAWAWSPTGLDSNSGSSTSRSDALSKFLNLSICQFAHSKNYNNNISKNCEDRRRYCHTKFLEIVNAKVKLFIKNC